MSTTIAIWALVVVTAIVAAFIVRFLNQLTKVAVEAETALKNLNTEIPPLARDTRKVLAKAEATVDRVNETLDDLDIPIHYAKLLGQLISEARYIIPMKLGGSFGGLGAGIRAAQVFFRVLKENLSHKKEDARED